MSASLRVVATTAPSRASSSSRAAVQMTVGCPATPPVAVSRSRCAKALAAVGMPPRRLASSVAAPRAVRADAPTETLDSATIDAISSVTAAANEAHAAALARAKEEAASWTPAPAADASSLRAKVLSSVADVQQGLLEREVEVRGRILICLSTPWDLERERGGGGKGEREAEREARALMASKHWLGRERDKVFFRSLSSQPHPLFSFFLFPPRGEIGRSWRERVRERAKRAPRLCRLCARERERIKRAAGKRQGFFSTSSHQTKKKHKN